MILVRTRRRAISTIVSTAIMLSAVAMIGTAVVAWSNTNVRSYETVLASSASDKTNKINEMFIIENVVFIPTSLFPINPTSVNVTVTNTGTLGLNVTQIEMINSTTNVLKTYKTGNITKGLSQTFSISPYTWHSGLLTTVQVTTARGSFLKTQVVP